MKAVFFDWHLSPMKPLAWKISRGRAFRFSEYRQDFHSSIHLNFVMDGEISLIIGNTGWTACKGECYITAPWEPHSTRQAKFTNDVLMTVIEFEQLCRMLSMKSENLVSFIYLPPEIRHTLLRKYDLMKKARICAEKILAAQGDDILRKWFAVLNFFVELLSVIPPFELQNVRSARFARIEPFFKFFSENTETRLVSTAEAAKVCSLSPSHFRMLFKQVLGMTFSAYELQYRLNGAANSLRTRSITVKEAAIRWGFYDQSHFIKLFKKHYGVTPSAYLETGVQAEAGSCGPGPVSAPVFRG